MKNLQNRQLSLSERVRLLPLSILISIREIRMALQALPLAINKDFLRTEVRRRILFSGRTPWRLSRDFYAGRAVSDIHCFGETPLLTLARIQQRASIGADDEVLEVGAATGRNCFWLATVTGCRVVGLEHIPEFVNRANSIASQTGNQQRIRFICGDMGKSLPGEPDIIYLYGSNLDDDLITRFARRCCEKGTGVKVITVSYPLTDYLPGMYELVDHFPAAFTWGVTTVYVQKVIRGVKEPLIES